MVAVPIGYDQPGTAARIAHHKVGEFIELDALTTERLRGLIEKVLHDPIYRARADYFRKVISKTRGLDVAADVIEQAFHKYQTNKPLSTFRSLVARGTKDNNGGLLPGEADRVHSY